MLQGDYKPAVHTKRAEIVVQKIVLVNCKNGYIIKEVGLIPTYFYALFSPAFLFLFM